METIRLSTAVLMPWLAGFLWLVALEHRLNAAQKKNVLRQLGYGFFLGYAVLYAVIALSTEVFGYYSFNLVFCAMAAMAAVGLVLAKPGISLALGNPRWQSSTLERALWALLSIWICLHLFLVAIEVFHRPVYPWDAWLSWMYRAKVWFITDAIHTPMSPMEWANNQASNYYNVVGNNYPRFVPSIGLWSASALGRWDDALVNVPVLLLGVALCLGLYGQCREYGANRLMATVGAYFLISLPLIGAHLSLAGLADIWMSGYTGLGLVALLVGLSAGNSTQIAIGLAMSGVSIAIKDEGLVWLLLALGIMFTWRHPRWTAIGATCACVGALVAATLGVTAADFPGVGKIGYEDGFFYLPYVGPQPTTSLTLWDDYFEDFFKRDSWHLLWGSLGLSLPIVWILEKPSTRRAILCFYIFLGTAQFLIFGLSDKGQWAEDGTAINRLPLHFAPALVFCLIVFITRCQELIAKLGSTGDMTGFTSLRVRTSPALIMLSSLALLCAGVYAYLQPADRDEYQSRGFSGEELSFVVGSGYSEDGAIVVDKYDDQIAIVSSGRIAIKASNLQILNIHIAAPAKENAEFFWRTKNDSNRVNSIHVGGTGSQTIDLRTKPRWQGTITETGFVFTEPHDGSASFRQLSVLPRTLAAQLDVLWTDWSYFEPWSQASANWIAGGRRGPLLSLPLLALCWLALVFCLIAGHMLIKGPSASMIKLALLSTLVAWIILDLRWTVNRALQANDTLNFYSLGHRAAYLDIGDDRETLDFITEVKSRISGPEPQLLVTSLDTKMRFKMLRAKYHLLPFASYVQEGEIPKAASRTPDYIVLLVPAYMRAQQAEAGADSFKNRIEKIYQHRVSIALMDGVGFVYEIHKNEKQIDPEFLVQ